jgi:outer membrane lipoprotein carrier protein
MKAKLLLALALLAAAPAHADPKAELQRFFDRVDTLQARFEQTVSDDKGGVRQRGSGTMTLSRPGRFRWEQTAPFKQLIVCDGDTIWVHDPDLDQVTKRPARAVLEGTPAALLAQGKGLTEQFTLEPGGAGEGAPSVKLVPKATDGDFQSIELWLKDSVPARMRFNDALGGITDVTFSALQVNAKVDERQYRFVPPPGTEVIEADVATSEP